MGAEGVMYHGIIPKAVYIHVQARVSGDLRE